MTLAEDVFAPQLLLLAVVTLLLIAPSVGTGRWPDAGSWGVVALLSTVALLAPDASLAYAATALVTLVHARSAWPASRSGAVTLALAAAATLGAAGLFATEGPGLGTLLASLAAIALRGGVVLLHAGVAGLCRHVPVVQGRQYASLLVLAFLHLRFADQVPAAHDLAPAIVRIGAASALIFGLTSLVQRDLLGLLQSSTLMHGGLLFAAVGAAGRGHHEAALFVAITMALALGGLTLMVLSLTARVGSVSLAGAGGRARALPRLASAFAFFGAAGVGMPGTAGFVADDLLLHALWEESVSATVAVVVAAALLAIATLRTIAAVFFGQPVRTVAPDLLAGERRLALALILLLFVVGLVPQVVISLATRVIG